MFCCVTNARNYACLPAAVSNRIHYREKELYSLCLIVGLDLCVWETAPPECRTVLRFVRNNKFRIDVFFYFRFDKNRLTFFSFFFFLHKYLVMDKYKCSAYRNKYYIIILIKKKYLQRICRNEALNNNNDKKKKKY